MLEQILSIINFIGALYFLQIGQFYKTKYFKIASLLIVAYIIGILFKITHFVFANELFIASSVGILLLYLKYFTRKPVKNRLDYLKLTWVVCTFGIGLIRFLHLTKLDLHIIPPVVMTFIIFEYFKSEKETS